MNQHRIILSSPHRATRTLNLRGTTDHARECAARALLDAPDAATARASVYRRGRNGFELVCFLRLVGAACMEVAT